MFTNSSVVQTIFLVLSVALLALSSEVLMSSLAQFSKKLKISSLLLSATALAWGTAAPEVSTSIYAMVSDTPEVIFGNISTSIITNILLVVGLVAVLSGDLKIKHKFRYLEHPAFIAVLLTLMLVAIDGTISRLEGIVMLTVLITTGAYISKEADLWSGFTKKKTKLSDKETLILMIRSIVGFVGLVVGAKFTVDSIIGLSELVSVSVDILSINIFALSAAIPEITVALLTISRKQSDLAIAYIISSSSISVLLGLGIPAIIGDFGISSDVRFITLPMIFVMLVAYIWISQDEKITRKEGLVLIFLYMIFIGEIVGFALY